MKIILLLSLIVVCASDQQVFQIDAINLAYRKQVNIEPPEGTCGQDSLRSEIKVPIWNAPNYYYEEYDYFENPNNFLEQAFRCAATCGRKYPQNYDRVLLHGTEVDDGLIFGDTYCTPFTQLSLSNRRLGRPGTGVGPQMAFPDLPVLQNPCYERSTMDINIPSVRWSYTFWIKPDRVPTNAGSFTILDVRDFRITIGDQRLVVLEWKNNGNTHTFTLSEDWSWFGLQHEEKQAVRMYAYSGGFNTALTIGENIAPERPEPRPAQVNVGFSPVDDGCETLQITQCREIYYSHSVQRGSQINEPLFPDFSQCDNLTEVERITITKYFCASYFPACNSQGVIPVCQQFCPTAVDLLMQKCPTVYTELVQIQEIWTCFAQQRQRRQATQLNCVASDTSFQNGLYRGLLRDFQVYPTMLTSRQLLDILNGTFPNYYVNTECMCSEDHPVSFEERENFDFHPYCFHLTRNNDFRSFMSSRTLRTDVAFQNSSTRFFSSQYITDDRENVDESGYWVSTPGVDPVSFTLDFETTIQVDPEEGIELYLISSPPEVAIVFFKFIDGVWSEWYYLAPNCSSDDIKSRGLDCTEYNSAMERSRLGGYKFRINFVDSPGFVIDGPWINGRLREFLLMDQIRVQFLGPPINSQDSIEYMYHAVLEFKVYGRNFDADFDCNYDCFPFEWGRLLLPNANRLTLSDEPCLCTCQQPSDRHEAGPQCVPYVTEIHPAYGPLIGGTVVTIMGGLLGNQRPVVSFQNLPNQPRVLLPCSVIYSNETMIICVTSTASEENSVKVVISHDNSNIRITGNQLFTYKPNPEVTDIYPLLSIVDGGIRLTVSGDNLNSVAEPQMRFRIYYQVDNTSTFTNYTKCVVGNSTVMYCFTPNVYNYLPPDYQERLNEDHTSVTGTSNQTLYRAKRTTDDGGLKSILNLFKNFISNKLDIYSHRRKRYAIDPAMQITDDYLRAYPEIRMDGARHISTKSVRIAANPSVNKFKPEVKDFRPEWPDNHEVISVSGLRMDEAASIEDYTIYIGKDVCPITDLLYNLVSCQPPQTKPNTDRILLKDGGLGVQLHVGQYNRHVGYLKYYAWWQSKEFIGMMVGLGLLILLIISCIVVCKYRRRKNKKRTKEDYYMDALSEVSLLDKVDPHLRKEIEESDLLKDCNSLLVHNEIGGGNFGKVFSGQFLKKSGEKPIHVAVKTLRDRADCSQMEEFLKEALIMKDFDHPNILELLGLVWKRNSPYVILPFMPNGDLRTYIMKPTNKLNGSDMVIFALDIARGMAYLEEKRFVHRDLAARNCMVDIKKGVKVADFGLARDIYTADYYKVETKNRPIPIRWMAIESMELFKFTSKTDVWSFGVVLWELFTRGIKPYPGVDNLDIKRFLRRGGRLEQPTHTPNKVYSIMKSCWETKPSNRPSFKELVLTIEKLLQAVTPSTDNSVNIDMDTSKSEYVFPEDYLVPIDNPVEDSIVNERYLTTTVTQY